MNRLQTSPELRNALTAKANECRSALSGARQDLEVDSGLKPLEDAAQTGHRQLAAEKIELYSRTLRQVEAALGRMESGSYGICLRCEEAIGPKRLDALPWAPYCVECQTGAELLHSMVRSRGGEVRRAA